MGNVDTHMPDHMCGAVVLKQEQADVVVMPCSCHPLPAGAEDDALDARRVQAAAEGDLKLPRGRV